MPSKKAPVSGRPKDPKKQPDEIGAPAKRKPNTSHEAVRVTTRAGLKAKPEATKDPGPEPRRKPAAKERDKSKASSKPSRDHLVTQNETDAEKRVSVQHGIEFVSTPERIDPHPLGPEQRDQLQKDHEEQQDKLAAIKAEQ